MPCQYELLKLHQFNQLAVVPTVTEGTTKQAGKKGRIHGLLKTS